LNSKCLTLEEENQKLREQLQKACNGEKIEPVLKKQKLNTGNSLPKKSYHYHHYNKCLF